MYKAQLRWQPIAILILLALTWGANMAAIKIGARELTPLFMAGFRSLVASLCLYIWMKLKKITIFPDKEILVYGMVVGLLFGADFAFLYVGLQYTLATRAYVCLYTAPFFVAIGAHFFLAGDRLNLWKVSGLILAFAGMTVLFMNDLGTFSLSTLTGDLLAMLGGVMWGSTTVYVKKYLAHKTVPLQTLFYQLFFSIIPLFILSLLMEGFQTPVISKATIFSVFYQCIIIAFLSYLVWFELVYRFPISILHAFSFFTPVCGVFISGVLILHEPITLGLIVALILVSLGMVLVNRRPATQQ